MSESSEQPIIQSNPSDTDTKSSKPSLAPKLIAKGRQNPNHVRITEEGREIAKAMYHDAKSANNNNLEDVQKYARAEARKTTEELKKVRSAIRKEIAAQWKAEGRKPTQDKEAFKQALQEALIHSNQIDNLKAVRSMYKSVDARAIMDSKYTASLPLQTQEELQAAIQDPDTNDVPPIAGAEQPGRVTDKLQAYQDTDALAMRVLESPPERPEYGVGNAFWDTVRLLDLPDAVYSPVTHQNDTNDNTTQNVVAQAEVHDQQGKLINIWEKQGKFTNGKLDGTYVESLKTIDGEDVATVIVRYDANGNAVSVIRRNYEDSGTPNGNTVLLYNYDGGIPVSVTERVIDKYGNRVDDVNKPLRPASKETDQTQPPVSEIPTPEAAAADVPVTKTGTAPVPEPAGEASTVAEASLHAAPENPAPAASPPPEASIDPQEQAEYEALAQREIELMINLNKHSQSVIEASTDGNSHPGKKGVQTFMRKDGQAPDLSDKLTPKYLVDTATSILSPYNPRVSHKPDIAEVLAANGIYETVTINPLTQAVFETRTRQVPDGKNFLGRQKYKTIEEQVEVGTTPIAITNITGEDTTEKGVGIYYTVNTAVQQGYQSLLPGKEPNGQGDMVNVQYLDIAGRKGTRLEFKMMVPESLAREFSEVMKRDPFFVRKMVDYQMRSNYSQAANSEYDKRARPAWDLWPKYVRPQMLVVDRLANPQAGTDAQTKAGTGFNTAEVVHPQGSYSQKK